MVESVTVGNVRITAVADVTPPPFDPNRFFPDVSLEKWEPYKKDHLDANGKFQTNFCTWILQSPSGTILVDTGLGPGPHQPMGGVQGQLLTRLRPLGVRYDDIAKVVITHLHGDHIGWNMLQVGNVKRATFPKAKYLVSQADWDYFTKPDVLPTQAAVQNNAVPLQTLGALELVSGEHAVTAEVSVLPTPGHTPGHMSVLVTSGGEKAMIVGDLFHGSVQVSEPDWCPGADMDKDTARRTRHAIFDRLEREGFVVAASHLPPGKNIGKVVRLQGRRYWQVL